MKDIIVLDRDGVINTDLLTYVTRVADFVPIEFSLDAISLLNKNGFRVVIATNQACIEKKIISTSELDEIHFYMQDLLREKGGIIEYIAYCPHAPESNCDCRKPETGLLKKIEKKLGVSLNNKYFIGDKESDILAGLRHGCIPILIRKGPYGEQALNSEYCPPPEHCFDNLMEASKFIINSTNKF